MKTILYWTIILLVFIGGIAGQWQPLHSIYQSLGVWALIFCIAVVPGWMAASSRFVKLAIDNAQKSNFKVVRSLLVSWSWFIFPSFKYNDIVILLRQLCLNPERKPVLNSSEFSRYIVNDGMGYILTWAGREKMLEKVNSSWINGKFYEDPKYLVALLRVVVAIAIIRGVLFVIGLFTSH